MDECLIDFVDFHTHGLFFIRKQKKKSKASDQK